MTLALPRLTELFEALGSVTDSPTLAWTAAGMVGFGGIRFLPMVAFPRPAPAVVAVAAVSAPVLLASVLTRTGVVGATALGLGLWWVGKHLDGETRETESIPAPSSMNGAGLGLLLGGALPIALLQSAPLVGGSLGGTVRCVATVTLGSALAAVIGRTRAGGIRYLGPAAALAVTYFIARAPLTAILLGERFESVALTNSAGWIVATTLGLLAVFAPPPSRGTLPGFAMGLLIWWWAPGIVGPDAAFAGVVTLWALSLLPAVTRLPSPAARAGAGLAIAIGAGATLAPTPPTGLRAVAPYSISDPAERSELIRRYLAVDAEVFGGSSGQAVRLVEDGGDRIWTRGRSRRLDPRRRDADRFFGYLASLVGPVPQSVLVVGSSLGVVADALRGLGPLDITVHEASPADARLVRTLRDWNRDAVVDPAVRLVDTDPVLTRATYDAVLVDLPPPWAAGSGAATSPRRIAAVAGSLRAGGVAVFRLPLSTLAPKEIRRTLGAIVEPFGAATAWLDPSGADHLLVTCTREAVRVDAGAVFRAWDRRRVRRDLQAAAITSPAAILDRALADRPALLLAAEGLPYRDAAATAVLSGRRLERGAKTLALSALGAAAADPRGLFDLGGVPADERQTLDERLERAADTRDAYLEMLAQLAAGNPTAAMKAAESLPQGGEATADLRVLTEPWLRRGDAMRARGNVEGAHAEYLLAYSFSEADPEANRKLADTYRLQGRLDDAMRHYENALRAAPSDLQAALGLADAHARAKELPKALATLEEIEQAHPSSYVLLVNMAHFETEIAAARPSEARDRLGRARRVLQRAGVLEPTRPEARAGLARVYYIEEEYDYALQEIDRALTLNRSCSYQHWRGLIQFRAGDLDAAAGDLKSALLACPDFHDARNALGAVYASNGNPDQARATWQDVLKRDPNNEGAKVNLQTLDATNFVPR